MTDQNDPIPRRRSKTPLFATLGLILVVGSVVGWGVAKFMTLPEEPGASLELPRDAKLHPANEDKANDGTKSSLKNTAPTAPQSEIKKPQKVSVDSYEPRAGNELSNWKAGKQLSGYFDSVVLGGAVLAKNVSPKLAESDILILSGWAGDVSVGVRYPYVIASACGVVFGHSTVSGTRADVAKAVHPNLTQSGWRMRVAATSIPDCENRAIRIWGVAPGKSRLILPLNGLFSVKSGSVVPLQTSKKPVLPNLQYAEPLSSDNLAALTSLIVTVRANTLNMRRCGDAKCAITGKIRKGDWPVVKMDESADWLLIAAPDRAGWVARRFVQIGDQ
ncbi:MAG: hypothetical protein JKY20_05435 [Alphaproteobacteria bacterium]|nr:hypothetical protein [Alphaproteobacteria bacterium]